MKSFGSDNHAPVHPDVLAAIVAANDGDAPSYGADPWTAEAKRLFRDHFGPDAEAHLVFNGTGANVLSLGSLIRPYEAVICADSAHVHTDECGAPERQLGCKLLLAATTDGRFGVEAADRLVRGVGDEHHVQARALSITQSTELGTRYPLAAVRELADWAHSRGLFVHMDGARLANAAAGLGVSLGEVSTGCGVDVLSFGGTKNGAMGAEAVVVLRPDLAGDLPFRRKQGMQLASKMRYAAAQFVALLSDDLWLRNARRANGTAARLAAGAAAVPGVRITRPVEANAVFAVLPAAAVAPLQAAYPFYVWDEATGEVRWMTSFATTEAEVDDFLATLGRVVGAPVAAR
ncbi:MAG: Low-specificity L-threonine aldolase [uncultured Corynebacteriales bacterium]|uniref:Low-specificity L-threonine aldolase n=1 Tax=uncultured Mycobacteriales bacterium TaxID=581187 RepID=A0A6J4JM29_9ACTN|nr:MAG: Low-specificity L-threonine aldolase [uncultured Corynebacteriales bacterium]